MIVRIVKMTFLPGNEEKFLEIFEVVNSKIREFDGCISLKLFRESGKPNVYFTYSHWQSDAHLNHYRNSKLFKETWLQTKTLFLSKAEAWSLEEVPNFSE